MTGAGRRGWSLGVMGGLALAGAMSRVGPAWAQPLVAPASAPPAPSDLQPPPGPTVGVEAGPAPLGDAAPVALAPGTEPVTVNEPLPQGPSESLEGVGDMHCLFGRLCVGPQLSAGAPHALGIGLLARYGSSWGVSVDHQWSSPMLARLSPGIPRGVDVTADLWAVEARYYPGGVGFFLSGGLGVQEVRSQRSVRAEGSAFQVSQQRVSRALKIGLGLSGPSTVAIQAGLDASWALPVGESSGDPVVEIRGVDGAGISPATGAVPPVGLESRLSSARADVNRGYRAVLVKGLVPQLNLLRLALFF